MSNSAACLGPNTWEFWRDLNKCTHVLSSITVGITKDNIYQLMCEKTNEATAMECFCFGNYCKISVTMQSKIK